MCAADRTWFSLALAVCALAAPVSAQELDTRPGARVDVFVPTFELGTGSMDAFAGRYGAEVAFADKSGHGARLGVALYDGSPFDPPFGPAPAQVGGELVDAAYVYRVRLEGNDRFGIGLDLGGGVSVGHLRFYQGRPRCLFISCDPAPPRTEPTITQGAHFGGNVMASLDFRVSVFVVGIAVRYSALLALERNGSGPIGAHYGSGGAHIGFGFY
jgi:hypothetical protein